MWFVFAYASAGAVAWLGRRLGWLDGGGAAAAAIVGGTVFAFGRWPGAALLLTFFVTSSLLSRLPNQEAPGDLDPGRSPGEPRTGRQVMANGAVAALCAAALPLGEGGWLNQGWPRLALAGSLAAATADTWASEVGRFFGQRPRSAITMRTLEPGESGGMTTVGTFAGMMGAALIGWAAAWVFPGFSVREALVLEAAGFFGMWTDSLLGASVQFRAECPACRKTVEDPGHAHELIRRRGLTFVDNDVVNVIAGIAGAAAAVYLGSMWP